MNPVNVRVSLTEDLEGLTASETGFKMAVKPCVCVCVCKQ
jgi:hypothetical protein